MHLIVCIDTRDGMSFCDKRLSTDSRLNAYILRYTSGAKLWMDPYSTSLFPEADVRADADFLHKAKAGEYCFSEITPLEEINGLESVTLCHWNRSYPSTQKFPRSLLAGLRLVHTEDFPGNSHEKISIERYTL